MEISNVEILKAVLKLLGFWIMLYIIILAQCETYSNENIPKGMPLDVVKEMKLKFIKPAILIIVIGQFILFLLAILINILIITSKQSTEILNFITDNAEILSQMYMFSTSFVILTLLLMKNGIKYEQDRLKLKLYAVSSLVFYCAVSIDIFV